MWPRDPDVFSAYRRAWQQRLATGDQSVQLLLDELERVPLDASPEARHDLVTILVDLWNSDTKPNSVRIAVLRAGLRLWWKSTVAVFAPVEESNDWMNIPASVRTVSSRYGDAVQRIELTFTPRPAASDILNDARDAPSNTSGWHCAPIWLEPTPDAGFMEVLIGTDAVGGVTVSPAVWSRLRADAVQNVFADGELWLRGRSDGEIETNNVRCVIPCDEVRCS